MLAIHKSSPASSFQKGISFVLQPLCGPLGSAIELYLDQGECDYDIVSVSHGLFYIEMLK